MVYDHHVIHFQDLEAFENHNNTVTRIVHKDIGPRYITLESYPPEYVLQLQLSADSLAEIKALPGVIINDAGQRGSSDGRREINRCCIL
ncbi:hypothetical protein BDV12DRAFT_178097 [Aspergillus spectabilis]